MDVCVRTADATDVPAISTLAKKTWADAFGSSVSAENEAAELEETRSEHYFRNALRDDTILIAEADGELVGYVQLGDVATPEVEVQPGDQQLRRVYVDTELQGRGIGRAHDLGFRPIGSTKFTIGGEVAEDLVMVLTG